MLRIAAYARYSSDNQRQASIEDQLRNINDDCDRRGWPRPTLVCYDEAISGYRTDRHDYLDIKAAVEAKAIDVLMVDDFERLGRNHGEKWEMAERCRFLGIRVIGVSDGLDTDRKGSKLEAGIRSVFSESTLDELAERTHRGLKGQALKGYSAGGLPYGYRSTFDGNGHRRVIDEVEARWVRYIFERYAAGVSPRQIADELNRLGVTTRRGNTWVHSALYPDAKGVGMLGNPIYIGLQIWNRTKWKKEPKTGRRCRTLRPKEEWVMVEVPELKIVDDATWHACELRARKVKRDTVSKRIAGRGTGGRGPKFLFSGLLKCGQCGGAYVIQGRKDYGCSTHQNRGASVCSNALKVRRSVVETMLLSSVKEALLTEEAFVAFEAETRALLKQNKPDPSAARRRLKEARQELNNLMAALRAGIVTPTTKAAVEESEQKLAAAQDELRTIEEFEPQQVLPRAKEIFKDLVAKLESIDDIPAAREALRGLVGEVRLLPEDGMLTAEMQSAGLAGALQITVVAGARFELATFGL